MANNDQYLDSSVAGLQPDPATEPSPWRKLKATLRGRLIWAVIVPALWAAVAVAGVHKFTTYEYQSEGAVRVKAFIAPVLYPNTGETGIMPMVKSFADAQAGLMASESVLEAALQDPAWDTIDLAHVPAHSAALRRMIHVTNPEKDNLIIRLKATHTDPQIAQLATRAVVDAYMDLRNVGTDETDATRRSVLEQRRRDLTARLVSLREQVYDLAREYGSDDLENAYNHQLRQLQEREKAINDAQLELASLTQVARPEETDAESQPQKTMTIEEIAVIDNHMRELISQKRAMQRQLESLADEHPDRADLEQSMATQQGIIENYAAAYLAMRPTRTSNKAQENEQIAVLTERLERLKTLYAEARAQTLQLGRKKLEIDKLKGDIDMVSRGLEETERRIEQLDVESSVSERVEVVSRGNFPSAPSNEQKIQQLAALAGIGAGLLGFAVVLLSAHVDPRLLDSEDLLDGSDLQIMGMLPVLPDKPGMDDRAARATYAVHHMRSLMQVLMRNNPQLKVFCITSPAAQSGKTSIVLSLGLSFAASGSRTLLVDADLAGGGLSRRMQIMIPRLIGQQLVRRGYISREQLEEALKQANDSNKRIGEVLLERKLITEDELSEALELQTKAPSRVGFIDVLEGDSPEHCLTEETGIPNLSLLPLGEGVASDMTRVGPVNVRRLIEQVRGKYDQVLIDTGPIGGDIGAQLIAAEVDGVILCVSRGEQKRMARRALRQLRSIRANILGVVFNRARMSDLHRSTHSVDPSGSISRNQRSSRREEAKRLFIDDTGLTDNPVYQKVGNFGPVAQSVARSSVSLYWHDGRLVAESREARNAARAAAARKNGNNGNGQHPSPKSRAS